MILTGCSAGNSVFTTTETPVMPEVPVVPETIDVTEATETPIVDTPSIAPVTIGAITWSDGDSGRLAGVPFRL